LNQQRYRQRVCQNIEGSNWCVTQAGHALVHSITDADFTWTQTACPGSSESAARECFVALASSFDSPILT